MKYPGIAEAVLEHSSHALLLSSKSIVASGVVGVGPSRPDTSAVTHHPYTTASGGAARRSSCLRAARRRRWARRRPRLGIPSRSVDSSRPGQSARIRTGCPCRPSGSPETKEGRRQRFCHVGIGSSD